MFCVFSKLFLLLFSGKKKEKEKEKHQVHPARFELRTAQAKIGITFQLLAARKCKQHSFFVGIHSDEELQSETSVLQFFSLRCKA